MTAKMTSSSEPTLSSVAPSEPTHLCVAQRARHECRGSKPMGSGPTPSRVAPDARGVNAAARSTVRLLVAIAPALLPSNLCAQSGGDYDLTWHSVDGGGRMFSVGGFYEIGGTIGQCDARNESLTGSMMGGDYSATGGFWQTGLCGACQLFGDVVDVKSNPVPDCLIDVSDLLCVLDDFVDPGLCAGDADLVASDFSCTPDGLVDVSDLLVVLDAFAGVYACGHPCPA